MSEKEHRKEDANDGDRHRQTETIQSDQPESDQMVIRSAIGAYCLA